MFFLGARMDWPFTFFFMSQNIITLVSCRRDMGFLIRICSSHEKFFFSFEINATPLILKRRLRFCGGACDNAVTDG